MDELETIEAKLTEQRSRLVVVWRSIEHSRRGVVILNRDRYNERKDEMLCLQQSIGRLERDLHWASHRYQTSAWSEWSRELEAIEPRKYRLDTVWRLWRDVEAARKACADLPAKPSYTYPIVTDLWFANYCAACLDDKVTARQRNDAFIARDRAECTYNHALRAFEGRERWQWEKHADENLRAPQRQMPTKNNRRRTFVRSSYIGA
jgi:hypothetical protein